MTDVSRGGVKRSRRGDPTNRSPGDSKTPANDNSVIVKMFRTFQQELDAKNDKHERIVKLSRDVTIESKRLIFLLHRIDGDADRNQIVMDVRTKLDELGQSKWLQVAHELQGEDPYKFLRAYSPGLQEYVEAVSFWYYINEKSLISCEQIQDMLTFTSRVQSMSSIDSSAADMRQLDITTSAADATPATPVTDNQPLRVYIPPLEYMLGLADLTGELMRVAIHSGASGNLDASFQLCRFMRDIHDAFVSFGNISRELPRKITVLQQSLRKVEAACYTLQIRGTEMPRHLLAGVLSGLGTAPAYELVADDERTDCD